MQIDDGVVVHKSLVDDVNYCGHMLLIMTILSWSLGECRISIHCFSSQKMSFCSRISVLHSEEVYYDVF